MVHSGPQPGAAWKISCGWGKACPPGVHSVMHRFTVQGLERMEEIRADTWS